MIARHAVLFVILGMVFVGLAGCGTATGQLGQETEGGATSGIRTALSATARSHPRRTSRSLALRTSWMLPAAKGQNLMYVSDSGEATVDVLTYPGGKPVGALGIAQPQGMCSDTKGNVWISSTSANSLLEFAHGGTQPITTLTLQNEAIVGCAVDPSTGTLAVDSFCRISYNVCVSSGSVFIYQNTKSYPTQYGVLKAFNVYFCGYDGKSNLFVDANNSLEGTTVLGELPKGGKAISSISLDREVYNPGAVQWDGKYLAVGDQTAGNEITSAVYRFKITGSKGVYVGTTSLHGTDDDAQFWIQGKTIVAPNLGVGEPSSVLLYKYPAGGNPMRTIGSGTFEEPIGATVSLATK